MANITLVILILLLFISIFYSLYIKEFLNPIIIYTFFLTIAYSAYYFYYYKFSNQYILNSKTYIGYIIMIFGFFIGYFYMNLVLRFIVNGKKRVMMKNCYNNKIFNFIYYLSIVAFIVTLIQVFINGIRGPGTFFFNLRYATTQENKTYFGEYILLFSQVYLLLLITDRDRFYLYKKRIIILILMWITSSFFTMARTNLLISIISICITLFLSNKYIVSYDKFKISRKKMRLIIFLSSISFLFGYFYFAKLTNKQGEDAFKTFIDYLGMPIISFDSYIVNNSCVTYGARIIAPISKLLCIDVGEYKNIGNGLFNTFTAMSDPFLDFGLLGIFFVNIILGGIYSIVFQSSRRGNRYSIIFYSLITFCIFIGFYEYTFSYTLWIYYLIIILIYKNFD